MNDYIKCPNSNLLFYGTKLDGNGNDCAVFGTPNGRKFLIQRNSLWGTESWNTGSKSTMDAETFLSKNPNVTLERLEKDVIRAANESNASWGKNIRVYNKSIFDSKNSKDMKRVKDENTMDVLDGVLFIAFTDGTEDDMIAEVNKHANESDTIDGVQYETYETDSSDGVAMIDMCAATGDANAFVKALLNKWGIAENVADLEFEASDEMKEAVNDSRVNDMTKPAHLRGYAEKMRAKRRNKNVDDEPNTDEEKSNVSDSRRIKDSDDEYLLQEIANQLEEGYHAGYDPQWDVDITVDGKDISEFNYDDQDLIYQDIAYVVKDGYDNYMGIETELSDGSVVYVDFVLNY